MKTEVKKENGVFELNFSNIKSVEDVKEAIRQCRLVESQIADGFNTTCNSKSCSIAHGKIIIKRVN